MEVIKHNFLFSGYFRKNYFLKCAFIILIPILMLMLSCNDNKKHKDPFIYQQFRDSLHIENRNVPYDSTDVFDTTLFTPGADSLDTFLRKVKAVLQRDVAGMEQPDTLMKYHKKELFPAAEKENVRQNIQMIDSFFNNRNKTDNGLCSEKGCFLYVLVVKSTQILYLYIDGELKDSFPVSTGKKHFNTPDINGLASGPLFARYTSRKFPGGNYKGLGNMPYAVFVKGGYAIHGTTPGNFSQLGTVASHGCIRLHPDNARVFYELVKLFGLKNTWVTVRDSP